MQCDRRLWLEHHAPPPRAHHPEARTVRRDESRRVELLAATRFPGCVLVEGDDAAAETERLLADESVPALHGATFLIDGIRLRCDLLVRRKEGFDLVDVRSGLKVKRGHLFDVAVQLHLLRQLGLPMMRARICHLRRVEEAGTPTADTHTRLVDVTGRLPELPSYDVAALQQVLTRDSEPEVATGEHCARPWRCPFLAHCGGDTGLGQAKPPSGAQRSTEFVSSELIDAWPREPVVALDFEAFNTGLPDHPTIAPFVDVPYLWVARHSDRDEPQFFMGDQTDPRRAFAESLIAGLHEPRPILVWSSFEAETLGRLAARFADLAPQLEALRDRLVDLHAIVRSGYWSPALGGMYSVKAVAAALGVDFDYADLHVDNGRDAALLGLGLRRHLVSEQTAAELVRYCERDAEALLVIWRALSGASATQ